MNQPSTLIMKPYAFFKHDGSATPPVFELGEFDSDEAAQRHARVLLAAGPQYEKVEIWNGEDEPFTVERRTSPGATAAG